MPIYSPDFMARLRVSVPQQFSQYGIGRQRYNAIRPPANVMQTAIPNNFQYGYAQPRQQQLQMPPVGNQFMPMAHQMPMGLPQVASPGINWDALFGPGGAVPGAVGRGVPGLMDQRIANLIKSRGQSVPQGIGYDVIS